jgi:hypothetical protein
MVTLKSASGAERLDAILNRLCEQHDLKLYVNGWSRKTYDVYREDRRQRTMTHLARVESLASSNGEIRFFDDRAQDFAAELGAALEAELGIPEAVLIREAPPFG